MESNMQANDEQFMRLALKEAEKAFHKNEVPIGAVAIKDGNVIARAHNIRETTQDPLGHAEIRLLKKVSKKLKSWRLQGVTVHVTLEPCLMCMGALLQTRIDRLVFGAMAPNSGVGDHQIEVTTGILGADSKKLLKHFFQVLRNPK
ncbi:MAG: nucleoside deaminase [Deltaproteobacteria bacterium]|nr:nucleoside deaminase [Deltaproteobacteria bacterium]MBI4374563.1 nucleoside deaminase [Deltaproteobacteria bacterium]